MAKSKDMSYKTKAQREASNKNADKRIQALLVLFGNFLLKKNGIEGTVKEEDIKEFSKIIS